MKNKHPLLARLLVGILTLTLLSPLFPTAALAADPNLYVLGGGGGGGGGAGDAGNLIGGGGGGGGAGGYVGSIDPAGSGGSGGTWTTSPSSGGVGGVNGSAGAYGGAAGGTGGAGGLGDASNLLDAEAGPGTRGMDGGPSGYPDGGDGGTGGDASYPSADAAAYGNIYVIGGGHGWDGDPGPSGAIGGAGGAGGEASLTLTAPKVQANMVTVQGGLTPTGTGSSATFSCAGELTTTTLAVGYIASATIGTLRVAAGGSTLNNTNGGTVGISTLLFDPASTGIFISDGNTPIGTIKLIPPATASGGATSFSLNGFPFTAAPQLSVDPSNLNLLPGQSITLLHASSGLLPEWVGLTFGNYQTSISGVDLMLTRLAIAPQITSGASTTVQAGWAAPSK